MIFSYRPSLCIAICIASAPLAIAQTAPLRNTPATPATAAAVAASGAPGSNADQAKFMLKEVRFSPTRAVPAAELQALVKPFLNRAIDATDLSVIAAAIRRRYEEHGFGMVGVGYPPQDLTQGVLQIAIVEPQFGHVVIEASPKPPVSAQRAQRVLANNGIAAGQALDMPALDRAMFTLNDWPGVSAKATLLPTGDEGLYNLSVQTERRRGWDASIDADNYGSSVSGRYEIGTLLRWNNPAGIGDNLDLRLMLSNGAGTKVGRLGYEAPLGATPWRAGLGYSRVAYALGEQFAALGAIGTADVLDASLSYPLLRTREANLVGHFNLSDKKLHDETTDLGTVKKTIRAAELSASFESRSHWAGGGYSGGNVGVEFGHLEPAADSAPTDASTLGNFSKLSVQLTRLQALTRTLSLFVGATGQWASKNLDNAEKFTLGGDKGVRAYPAAEAASDQGELINTELRYWINPQWSSYAFYDWGHGLLVKTADERRTLRGLGLGVQFANPEWFTFKASLAVRGSEPVQSETHNPRTRLLVQVTHSF